MSKKGKRNGGRTIGVKRKNLDLNKELSNSQVRKDTQNKLRYYSKRLENSVAVAHKGKEEQNLENHDRAKKMKSPNQDNLTTTSEILATFCDSGIGMSLDSFKDQIESKIDALIDKKLNE